MKRFVFLLLLVSVFANAQTFEKPQWATGDRWEYQAQDVLNKKEPVRFINEVGAIMGDDIFVQGEMLASKYRFVWLADSKTNRLVSRHEFDAAAPNKLGKKAADSNTHPWAWALTVGKSWKETVPWLNAKGHKGRDENTLTVKGEESVTTPAGTFQTFKVVSSGWWYNEATGGSGRTEKTFWVAPAAKREVKTISQVYERSGALAESTTLELVAYKVSIAKEALP